MANRQQQNGRRPSPPQPQHQPPLQQQQQPQQGYAKEETGFSDPLGNCDDFNILNFINSADTPVDSPDMRYIQQQLMAPMQQQGPSGYAMPPQQPPPQAEPPRQQPPPQQQQQRVVVCDQNGRRVYANGQSRLPDSPPVTDVSAGGSSGSPSSDSPYSPDHYPNYQYAPGPQQIQLNMNLPGGGEMLVAGQPTDAAMHSAHLQMSGQTQVSPNSDFLSPYPPQTPGSAHSQVSPPGMRQTQSFIMDHAPYGMDMYLSGNEDLSDLNLPMEYPQMPHAGQKRRRVDRSMVKNEYAPVPTPLPGQSGYGGPNGMLSSSMASLNGSPTGGSIDDFDECNQHRTIKFVGFEPQAWAPLFDGNQMELPQLKMAVIADKGFNFSNADNCFVNQKKNHFQITVVMKANYQTPASYVMTEKGLTRIRSFKLVFCGAKSEMTSSEIQIRQSQTDRKPIPHQPVELNIEPMNQTKVTVPRLHFSETTMNNHRKNGKPNPDQKFFHLLVKLLAETDEGSTIIQAYYSDKVIVRASNPGQFEPPENDVAWQKSANNILYYMGPVAVGTDKAISDAQLTVLGNIISTGQHTRPSDRRVKEDILDVDTTEALSRINQVRVVEYAYRPEIAQQWGLTEENRHRVGVIAQELAEILPDAVKDSGEFLTVDDSRIFYDTVAAAQELYRLTGNLENKIDQVEKISAKLARFAQKRRQMGVSMASGLSGISQFPLVRNALPVKSEPRDEEEPQHGEDRIGDANKSYLSQSHLSLTSVTPSIDGASSTVGSASQYGSRRRRHGAGNGCRSGYSKDQSMCGSKLTQCTMVTLVVIMSLCLVTMCTLYVLDWYNRTYVYSQHSFPRSMPTMEPSPGIGKMIELKSWIPTAQPLVHPLLASCTAFGGAKCQTYCCAAQNVYNSTAEEIAESQRPDQFVALPKPGPPIVDRPAKRPQPHEDERTPPIPLESGVEIRLLDLNISIDGRYCVGESCKPRKGRYDLYVPVSPYMPTVSLRLKFNAASGAFVDECGHPTTFETKSCEFDVGADKHSNVPTLSKINEKTFEISAGSFMRSAYQFRVGHSTDSCSMTPDQQGRSYDEYNIVFYRQCSV